MTKQQPRPPQATFAGVLIIGGSVLLILAAWQRISTLHTLDAQRDVETWLSTNNLEGITVDGMLSALRVLCIVGAGAAAASMILGFQVFKRSTTARIVLAVLAPLLFVGAVASDLFIAVMAVFGIGLLWAQPTRDWYAGRPWLQAHLERRAARFGAPRPGAPTLPDLPGQPGRADQPGPGHDHAGHPAPPPGQQPGHAYPPPPPGHRLPPHRPQVRRPGALVAACILTWVLSGMTLVLTTLTAVLVATQGGEVFDQFREQEPDLVQSSGMTEQQFVATFLVVAIGLVLWSATALVLAVLAFVGRGWARITLAVSGVCAALLTLVMAISGPPLLVPAIALGVGTWLLLRPEVAAWFATVRRR